MQGYKIRDEGLSSGLFHTYDELHLAPGKDRPRRIDVFLPHNYESLVEKLPVVYMNDGHKVVSHNGRSKSSWRVEQVLAKLYREDVIPKLMVVAIHPHNRFHEYLHVREFSPNRVREGGGLCEYSAYLTRLKNFIDSHYPTEVRPEFTAVVGSSHGGLAAFYAGIRHHTHFGLVGAISPSFWAGGADIIGLSKSALIQELDAYLCESSKRSRIWIDWGTNHFEFPHNALIERWVAIVAPKMVRLLIDKYGYIPNDTLFHFADADAGHDEAAWSRRFELVLKQFYGVLYKKHHEAV